jgi:hypothetical protein
MAPNGPPLELVSALPKGTFCKSSYIVDEMRAVIIRDASGRSIAQTARDKMRFNKVRVPIDSDYDCLAHSPSPKPLLLIAVLSPELRVYQPRRYHLLELCLFE